MKAEEAVENILNLFVENRRTITELVAQVRRQKVFV